MDLHKLLVRQLNRLNLNTGSVPPNLQEWQAFLTCINTIYLEADQERYLNERSIDISSRELLSLNEKLENAQHIAHLGYWLYDRVTKKIFLSKELLYLFGIDMSKAFQNLEKFMEIVHQADRSHLNKMIQKSFSQGNDYKEEIRIRSANNEYRWYYVMGHPLHESDHINRLSGIAMDITQHKQAQVEVTSLNQKLLIAARQAGMADIATSTLHNVGNILNSANVSVGILQENSGQPYFKKLISAIDLLEAHKDKLAEYLTNDPKGQLIPPYFIAISKILTRANNTLTHEISNLNVHLKHIREIVSMQQEFSGTFGIIEKIFLPEAIDLALQMSGYSLVSKNIQIKKIYKKTPFIMIDKSKLLQIFVNLIQNAKEALMANNKNVPKKISFFIEERKCDNEIVVMISDNGIGIEAKNLVKIFSFGFTNKVHGHGIGLHSCAITAKEIGCNLRVESKGIGEGATFILTIPFKSVIKIAPGLEKNI